MDRFMVTMAVEEYDYALTFYDTLEAALESAKNEIHNAYDSFKDSVEDPEGEFKTLQHAMQHIDAHVLVTDLAIPAIVMTMRVYPLSNKIELCFIGDIQQEYLDALHLTSEDVLKMDGILYTYPEPEPIPEPPVFNPSHNTMMTIESLLDRVSTIERKLGMQ